MVNGIGTICHSDCSSTNCGCWNDSTIDHNWDRNVRILFIIYENRQRYHPHGECFCLTQPMLENIREKRNRQDMISPHEPSEYFLTRIHEFFISANLPRWLPNSFVWWRYNTLPQLANRNRKTLSSDATAQAQYTQRHVAESKFTKRLSANFSVDL